MPHTCVERCEWYQNVPAWSGTEKLYLRVLVRNVYKRQSKATHKKLWPGTIGHLRRMWGYGFLKVSGWKTDWLTNDGPSISVVWAWNRPCQCYMFDFVMDTIHPCWGDLKVTYDRCWPKHSRVCEIIHNVDLHTVESDQFFTVERVPRTYQKPIANVASYERSWKRSISSNRPC